MSEIESVIEIIERVRMKISEDTIFAWTKYNSAKELLADIDEELAYLKSGKMHPVQVFHHMFGPTGTFQEISINNGWSDEYMSLAKRFDDLYEKIFNA